MAKRDIVPPRLNRISPLTFVSWLLLATVILVSISQVAPTPTQFFEGFPRSLSLLDRMWPPNLDERFLERIGKRIIETLQIALAGAFIGTLLSLPLAWLAARGVSPLGRFHYFVKAFVSFLRTIPDLIWALLFVITVGLGEVAGTLTIAVDTIGFCGRFFAEAMEDADKEPQMALSAIGANHVSIMLGAILPDAAPSMINASLFALEKAVRSSVVLGLVGAGGIGIELKAAFDLFQYRNASTIILVIFIVVLVIEYLTDRLRARIQ